MPASDTINVLVPAVTALLSGGLVGGVSQILHARNTARQIRLEQDRSPADIEAVLLGGASQAVTVLTNSLQWTQNELKALKDEQAQDKARIRELMNSNDQKDRRVNEMERELQNLRVQLAEVQTALDRAQLRIQEMRGGSNGHAE